MIIKGLFAIGFHALVEFALGAKHAAIAALLAVILDRAVGGDQGGAVDGIALLGAARQFLDRIGRGAEAHGCGPV